MLSLQFIRENPEAVRRALINRGMEDALDPVLQLDKKRRELLVEIEALKAERNAGSRRIGAVREEAERAKLIEQMRLLSEKIAAHEPHVKEIEEQLNHLLQQLPNVPSDDTPVGEGEEQNVIVRSGGEPPAFDFEPRPHWELGERLGIIDFERGVRMSGSRFYVLRDEGARLERALITWMLDLHREQGYREVYPPFIVREETMWASGQLPKFRDNLYHDVEDDVWLVPTAEVPLTSLHRDEIMEPGVLPLYYVAYTPCFRREKMSAGRDVRGIKRGHQFDKVEMYKFCQPETSNDELEAMVRDAEAVCRGLGLHYRVKQLCTGDLGFTAAKAYDVDVWAPGSGEWLEVSTCSNCTDYQARRANIRFRREKGARPEFVHTLNGSGLGLPRTLAAVMETHQQRDGSIVVPAVLRPYMGGLEIISPS